MYIKQVYPLDILLCIVPISISCRGQ